MSSIEKATNQGYADARLEIDRLDGYGATWNVWVDGLLLKNYKDKGMAIAHANEYNRLIKTRPGEYQPQAQVETELAPRRAADNFGDTYARSK